MTSPFKLKLKLTPEQAHSLSDFDLCEKLWQLVEDATPEFAEFEDEDGEVDEEAWAAKEAEYYDKLPSHWWLAHGIHEFSADFYDGFFQSYLFNHGNADRHKMIAAFRQMGAEAYVKPFSDACSAWDEFRNLADTDYESAHAILDDRLAELDRRVYDDINKRLATYIRDHLQLYTTMDPSV